MEEKNCPKCKNKMEVGKVVQVGAINIVSGYLKWTSKIKGFLGSLENAKDIITYKCSSCGYLESYAT